MNNRKIDIYTKRKFAPRGTNAVWVYDSSTTWAKTCKQAKTRFCAKYALDETQVKANFAERV